MATGKSGSFTLSTTNFTAKISWAETYNVESNISVVSINSLQVLSSAYAPYSYFPNGTIKINGSTIITFNSALGSHSVDIMSKNTYYNVKACSSSYSSPPWSSGNIAHNSDGSKTVTIELDIRGYSTSGGGGSGWRISGSKSVDLTTIPRASTIDSLSCSTSYFDGTLTYKYTPKSANFYNKCNITLNINGEHTSIKSITIGKKSASQQTATVTLSSSELSTIYSKLPATTKGILRFTFRTYSDSGYSTQIGSAVYKEVTLTIPTGVKPTIDEDNMTLSPATINDYRILVKGKNALTIEVTGCSAGSGSTIKSYTFSGPSLSKTVSSTSTSASTSVSSVSSTGTLTYKIRVTDARGRYAEASKTITCYDYYTPSLSSFEAYRANSDGTANVNGTYLKCTYTAKYASVNSTNSATVTAYYNGATETGAGGNVLISLNGDTETTYEVYLKIVDAYGGSDTTSTITVFGQSRILNITSDGTGIALGKMAESSQLFESRWPAKFDDAVEIVGDVSIPDDGGPVINGYSVGTLGPGTDIPSGSDLNNYTIPGVYRSSSATISESLLNTPYTSTGFKLVVEHIGNVGYLRQTIITRSAGCTYYMRYQSTSSWHTWQTFSADDSADYLPLSGGTLTGKLTLDDSLYYASDTAGVDCNNSDIINANAIYFADKSNSAGEAINFYHSDGYWDTLYAADGALKFHPNRATSTALGGYTIYNSSNFRRGTCTLNCSSNTTVSFSSALGGTPTVILTQLDDVTGVLPGKVISVSSTGFTATIGGSATTSDVKFAYLAIYY